MNTKSIFTSKTIIGIVIAAAPTIAQLFGYHLADSFAAESAAVIDQVTQLVGLALATYGRLVATAKLVVKNP